MPRHVTHRVRERHRWTIAHESAAVGTTPRHRFEFDPPDHLRRPRHSATIRVPDPVRRSGFSPHTTCIRRTLTLVCDQVGLAGRGNKADLVQRLFTGDDHTSRRVKC